MQPRLVRKRALYKNQLLEQPAPRLCRIKRKVVCNSSAVARTAPGQGCRMQRLACRGQCTGKHKTKSCAKLMMGPRSRTARPARRRPSCARARAATRCGCAWRRAAARRTRCGRAWSTPCAACCPRCPWTCAPTCRCAARRPAPARARSQRGSEPRRACRSISGQSHGRCSCARWACMTGCH